MGIIRKTMSISTLGVVPWRNAAERAPAARYARQTRNAARVAVVQNQAMLRQGKRAARAAQQPVVFYEAPVRPAPGWYTDPFDPRCVTWWDGLAWHGSTRRWA